jgi:hypothetical protein
MPQLTDTDANKLNWLLTENWKCYVNNKGYDMDQCHQISDADPVFKLHQSGFLSWMNERGRQCINHITGVFHPVNQASDGSYTYTAPSATNTGTTTHECWQECMTVSRAGTDNEPCVKCIMDQITLKPSLCVSSLSKELMTDVLDCQMALVPEMLDDSSELSYPQIWSILTSDAPRPKTLSTTMLIIIIVVVVVGSLLFVIAYNQFIYHPRLEALGKKKDS